ncbi:MAG: polysaccharide biosynthesis/export family protein [Desulfobaccales bacterium]
MDRCRYLLMPLVALFWLAGCSSSGTITPQKASAQLQTKDKKDDLNQQILAQGAAANLRTPRDYTVGPEDLLEIGVYGQKELQRFVRVNGSGDITMPLIGLVQVAGLTPQQVESHLQELYGTNYLRNPQVSVFVKEYRHQQVAVTGAVKKPGSYEMIGPRTLLEMLALAGGLDEKAGDYVHIIRSQRTGREGGKLKPGTDVPQSFALNSETIVLDLRRLSQDGRLNVPIQAGDVINVPIGGLAYVLGSVNKPGTVPVKGKLTVSQAVAVAGSPVAGLAKPQISSILRIDEQGNPTTIPFDLYAILAKKELDIPLKENDVVYVPESILRRLLLDVKQLVGGGISYSAGSAI